MPIEVDIADVLSHSTESIQRVDGTYGNLIKSCERNIAIEKRTHAYQNRTGRLEAMTVSQVIGQTPDGGIVTMSMIRPYASYVNDRGFSRIDDLSAQAQREHEAFMEKTARDIGRK